MREQSTSNAFAGGSGLSGSSFWMFDICWAWPAPEQNLDHEVALWNMQDYAGDSHSPNINWLYDVLWMFQDVWQVEPHFVLVTGCSPPFHHTKTPSSPPRDDTATCRRHEQLLE